MSDGRNPYEVLGVPRNASTPQIRAAYVERARRVHPDLVGLRGLDGMRALNEAWEVLKDASRRQAFDAANGGSSAGAPGTASYAQDDPTMPFWTGAMGPPPGRPWGPVLQFGIYAKWSLGEISRRDRGYLMWLRDKPEAKAFRAEIDRLLNPDGDETPDPRRRGRR